MLPSERLLATSESREAAGGSGTSVCAAVDTGCIGLLATVTGMAGVERSIRRPIPIPIANTAAAATPTDDHITVRRGPRAAARAARRDSATRAHMASRGISLGSL